MAGAPERKNSSPPGNFKFAIPKKGRLYEKCVELLKGAGIEFHREARLDVALCVGLPMTLVFLPAADIAKFVGKGDVDIGITGFDVVTESAVEVDKIMDLGFGKCRLCVQAPVLDNVTDVESLAGKRIATSFTGITSEFFKPIDEKNGTKTDIFFVSGSVEAACGLGLADAVVDLVETGTTMKAAGLEVVHSILSTEAILISNPASTNKDLVALMKNRIEGYITATKYVMIVYNIANEKLDAAVKVTPGKRSPTITSLECGTQKSVSSLVLKKEVSEKMDALQAVGATDILVLGISNSRM
eukprot:Nitzschia sp. Nitz4//scaffold289_size23394//22043//23011//NITZ4_008482-RA/size23394-augustus-gene-0.43-mRNA-1//-1//CDS//3329545837//3526//frame0